MNSLQTHCFEISTWISFCVLMRKCLSALGKFAIPKMAHKVKRSWKFIAIATGQFEGKTTTSLSEGTLSHAFLNRYVLPSENWITRSCCSLCLNLWSSILNSSALSAQPYTIPNYALIFHNLTHYFFISNSFLDPEKASAKEVIIK